MFETDDIELVYEELKNKGVKTIGEIRTEPYGKLLTLKTPTGIGWNFTKDFLLVITIKRNMSIW